jgi:hypothetical protein
LVVLGPASLGWPAMIAYVLKVPDNTTVNAGRAG